jgi:hypothetical protein
MKSRTEKGRTSVLAAFSVLALGAITCNALPFGLGRQEPEARIATLEAELREARRDATAQAEGGTASTQDEVEAATVQEDFEGETAAFQLGDGAALSDGALLLGPFENVPMTWPTSMRRSAASWYARPAAAPCPATICEPASFEDGLSDRVRCDPAPGGRRCGRPAGSEDYLLALGFNIFENRWRIYLHEPDKLEPWRTISGDRAGFLLPGRMNVLDVTVTDSGRRMEIRLNDRLLELLSGGEAEPNERSVAPWIDSGAVGLIGLGRGVQARFDDFRLEPAQ